jgi:aldose 1-epimerase
MNGSRILMQSKRVVHIQEERLGKSPDGCDVCLFHLQNDVLEVSLSNYGARLVRLRAPDRSGLQEDVVLGFDTLEDYIRDTSYMGATVGRFANRIANGTFELDGEKYAIQLEPGVKHALHGGAEGFDRRLWTPQISPAGVRMQLTSPHYDMGFPGRMEVEVRYVLYGSELHLILEAVTDKATVVNLTNHAYFNLRGNDHGDILSHEIRIFANTFTPIDSEAIPTGTILTVQETSLDLRRSKRIGDQINGSDGQIELGEGFNHNFVLDGAGNEVRPAAEVYEPVSGRTLSVETSQPGLQFYSGNALNGIKGRHGKPYTRHTGFCLETQHFPDSPHHPHFPSTVLRVGERFSSKTIYKFGNR